MARKQLNQFDGRDVVGTTIALTNAGDGLSKAVATEPIELHHGEKVYVVFETEVSKVRFDKSKDDASKLVRVHTLKAGTATIVDFDLVSDVLTAQEKKNDEAEGKQKLPGMENIPRGGGRRERTPGGEPAPVASLAEKALEKAAAAGSTSKRRGKGAAETPAGDE